MAEGLGELTRLADGLEASLTRVPREAGPALAAAGKEEVERLAVRLFGGDRAFSNARHSRKAKRPAGGWAKVMGDEVKIGATGDPFFIWVKGRGRHTIRPHHGRAVLSPFGPRRKVRGGRLAPRADVMEPAYRALTKRAPEIVSEAVDDAIRKAL